MVAEMVFVDLIKEFGLLGIVGFVVYYHTVKIGPIISNNTKVMSSFIAETKRCKPKSRG